MPPELYKGGVSVEELRALNFSLRASKADGLTAAELRQGGFSPKQLKGVNFTEMELVMAGIKPRFVEAVDGRPPKELKSDGFTADELRAAGFSTKELKLARFEAQILKSVGYSAEEMRHAGYALRELIREMPDSPARSLEEEALRPRSSWQLCSVMELKATDSCRRMARKLNPVVVEAMYTKKTMDKALAHQVPWRHVHTSQRWWSPPLSECHQAGYSFEDGVAAGFRGKQDDWMTVSSGSPYNKWGF